MRHFAIHLLVGVMLTTGLGAPAALAEGHDNLQQAITLYRQGKYLDAEPVLSRLHEQRPEDSAVTYYLGITEAQLGRFDQARAHYEAVLLLEPNGRTAELARTGLQYLPARTSDNLDLPPRFEQPVTNAATPAYAQPATATNSAMAAPTYAGQNAGYNAGMNAAQGAAQAPGTTGMNGMSPQDLMMMQMMMGGNGNNGGGINPMLFGMMGQGQQPGVDGAQGGMFGNMDPNVMSTMMMNQMMQNFDLMGGDHNDRN